MNIRQKRDAVPVLVIALMSIMLFSCDRSRDVEIVPPSSPPLSRAVIGYGILINSYTHVFDQPDAAAVSLGYLREGAVVSVLERRMIEQNNKTESWVFVKGTYEGWLKEASLLIYENEAQAHTAAESLL